MNSKTKRANNQVNSVMNVQEQREMVVNALLGCHDLALSC